MKPRQPARVRISNCTAGNSHSARGARQFLARSSEEARRPLA